MTPPRLRRVRRPGVGYVGPDGRTWTGPPPVYVGRPSRFENPYVVGRDGDRAWCVEAFAMLLRTPAFEIPMCRIHHVDDLYDARRSILTSIGDLRGKPLACWCPHGAPCHADVLIGLANGPGKPG